MGIGVSGWPLARAVAKAGQLGVISSIGLETILTRRLQLGDPGGHIRRAFDQFPFPDVAQRVYDAYYVAGGKAPEAPFRPVPMYSVKPSAGLHELSVLAGYTEVKLAREGHEGPVGINYMCKIPWSLLASMYGSILGGVDYIIAGAGNPEQIPSLLTRMVAHDDVAMELRVQYADPSQRFASEFSPRHVFKGDLPALRRPQMLAIIASNDLAQTLVQNPATAPDGFIIEGPTAGGHNAPPRGPMRTDAMGQPIYGPLDEVDLSKMRGLGVPFWLAGSYGSPDGLRQALDAGAAGIQVGTAFAFCRESGLRNDLKKRILQQVMVNDACVRTDPRASPTGFPFKVVQVSGTMSDAEVLRQRTRVCDLGYLRVAYKTEQGSIGYRCPSESEEAYVRKAGRQQNTTGRMCLCNCLLAGVGLGQWRAGQQELPVVTAGDDLVHLAEHMRLRSEPYSAAEVVQMLLGEETVRAIAPTEAWPEAV